MRTARLLYVFEVLVLMSVPVWSATSETGAILFQEPFGARPFAMGQAYSAIGDDVFGLSYNPAILSRLKESQAASQFSQSLLNTQMGYLGLASPLSPTQAFGLSVSYLDAGKADIFDANGVSAGKISTERDFSINLGYAHSLDAASGRLHMGGTAKLLKSTIIQELSATAYAADLGALYEIPWGRGLASVAAVASNLGPGISYSGGKSGGASDPLPLTTRLGLGYAKTMFELDRLTLGLEMDRVFHDNSMFESVGVEYNYHHACSLRLGYRLGQDLGNFTMGIGLAFRDFSVDYGLGLVQTFNSLQQFSLTYHFTVPRIRYGVAYEAGLTPLEILIRNVKADIKAKRYLDATGDLDRLEAFFPGTPEAASMREQVKREYEAILKGGPASPRYDYAQGVMHYRQRKWGDAILNLQAALLKDLDNKEIQKYLEISQSNYREEQKQAQLQRQARIGALFELADQAFEEEDAARALRIVNEILRIGPYQPAERLKRKIAFEAQRPRERPRPAPAAPARVLKPAIQTYQPSPQDIARAEQFYYEAVRNYADNDLDKALDNLHQGLSLNPSSRTLQSALENIEKVISQKQKSNSSAGNSP